MKKNILLILMFITMFFIGSNEAEALVCQVGQSGCTIDAIKKELGENSELACVYEVEFNKKNSTTKYYNYILYDFSKDSFFAGTTKNWGLYGVTKREMNLLNSGKLNENDNRFLITEEAYNKLEKNGQCPKNTYFDNNGNQICYDNNKECKNNGEKIDLTTNFNATYSRENNSPKVFEDTFKYIKANSTEFCQNNSSSNKTEGMCMYVNDGKFMYLFFDKSKVDIVLKDTVLNSKYVIPSGSGKTTNMEYNGKKRYVHYENGIKKITSCPEYVYANYKEAYRDANLNVSADKYVVSLESSVDTKITYSQYNCGTGTQLPTEQTCESLIDEELAEIINDIMTIISIGVPILLIGLLTYDFAKAVFAGDEKAVKDVKGHAVKRIIIAVIIFFVPTLVNLVFDLVNTVWEKNFEICVIEEK